MRARAWAVALAGALLLGACTSGRPDAAPSASPSTSPPSPSASRTGATPTPPPEPEVGPGKDPTATGPRHVPRDAAGGGALTVLTQQVPTSFDPTRAYFDSLSILNLVTRSLTQYAYDRGSGRMVLVPDMATDLGRPNADSTRWTFTLKPNLRYEDGTRVRARDVAYAVKRSFAQRELPGGPRYNQLFFAGGESYAGPFEDGLDFRGVRTSGRDITFVMRRPFAEMDYYASFPQFTAIPRSADDRADPAAYGRRPLATGPYRFSSYRPGEELTLVRNKEWDPASDPGRIQSVDTWRFEFGQPAARVERTMVDDAGPGQATASYDTLGADTLRTLARLAPRRVVQGPTGCTYFLAIDNRRVTDERVRRAIGLAFPYRAFWTASGELPGVTRLPGGPLLPPGTAGRVAYQPLGTRGWATDPRAARRLLARADARGTAVRFLFATDDPDSVSAKNVVVAGLEAAGLKPVPVPTTLVDRARDEADPDARLDVRATGWCSDWPTGGTLFPAQFDSRVIVRGADDDPNPAFFSEPAVDRRIREILDDVPPSRSAQAWGRLDRTIETRWYPVVNLGYSGTAMAHGSRVGGFELDEFHGMPTFTDMYLSDK